MSCPQVAEFNLVYIAYDAMGDPIYVGQTGHYAQRVREHKAKSRWFGDVAYFVTEACSDRDQAVWLERILIRLLNPRENKNGKDAGLLRFRAQMREQAVAS